MALPGIAASLPGLTSSSASAAGGTSNTSSKFDSSGWVVNFGGSNSVGGLPQWAIYAGIGLAAWWVWKWKR